ncbi:MAG TPA: transporter substrate-binding domain-containing protein [Streptosporangiaceae bacterium]|jgi:polar amino acid transport system substrate-binding protein
MRRDRGRTARPALAALALAGTAAAATGCAVDEAPLPRPASVQVRPAADLAARVPAEYRAKGALVFALPQDPPYTIQDASGRLHGVLPDLTRALGTLLRLRIRTISTRTDAVVPGIQSGRFDLGAPMGDFVERQRGADFADFAQSRVTVLVKADGTFHPRRGLDLCGRTAGVENGANTQLVLKALSARCARAGRPVVATKTFTELSQADLALHSARLDTVVAPTAPNSYAESEGAGKFANILLPDVTELPSATATYGIIAKKHSGLAAAVAAALVRLDRDGTYAELFAHWNLRGSRIAARSLVVNGSTQHQ